MINVKPIKSKQDFEEAQHRIKHIRSSKVGAREQDELDVLLVLVRDFETRHLQNNLADPISSIQSRMDQMGLSPRDLVPFIGSRSKVSEVLSGKRSVTMNMARALHHHLGIPAEVLLQEVPSPAASSSASNTNFNRYPIREMAKRGWLGENPDISRGAEVFVNYLKERAGGTNVTDGLFRRNGQVLRNAKASPYALQAWCWQVLSKANQRNLLSDYRPGSISLEFMQEVAQLSPYPDGPARVQWFLADNGIPMEVVSHLPRTYLDGAALRLHDGRPVIGLTLRYDRIDNFWYTLFHELAHVSLHFDSYDDIYFDDLTLNEQTDQFPHSREAEADQLARDSLVPGEEWAQSDVRLNPSTMAVFEFAQTLQIHPAIIAGRIRYERRNYRLLSQLVGANTVRQQFQLT